MQLVTALEEEKEGLLQPRAAVTSDKEEVQSSSPQPQEEVGEGEYDKGKEGEDEEDKAERRRSLVGMYGQAMELLVLKVMLVLGEGEAALERVKADRHLEGRVRQVSFFQGEVTFV